MRYLVFFIALIFIPVSFSQIAIGSFSVDPSAALDVNSSNKGLLIPSISLQSSIDVSTIVSPTTGLIIYNTSSSGTSPSQVFPGYYFYNGANWELLNYKNTDNVNVQTGSYTLTSLDVNSVILFNSSTPVNLIIPSSLAKGFKCDVIMVGSGDVTILGSGVSINSGNGNKLRLQNRSVGILKDSSNSAYIFGAISF
jgi:hypothetical protein